MHPDLLQIGSFTLKSYGVALAVSFILAILIAVKRAKKFGVDPDHVYNVAIVAVFASVIGSRFFYVIFHLDEFRGQWLNTINPFNPEGGFGIAGLSMMGGIVLVIIGVWLYTRLKKVKFTVIGDIIAPTFFLGCGITRLFGCFLNGCCYGKPTTSWFGVKFPHGAAGYFWRMQLEAHPDAGYTGLIPTQVMASILGFILFFVILKLEKNRDFDGFTSWLVLGFYSIDRFFVDQFRYYEPEQVLGYIGPVIITVNEIVLIGLFVLSAVMFIRGKKLAKNR